MASGSQPHSSGGNVTSRRLLPLNALKAFEVAGRHLNFSAAAEELSVTLSATITIKTNVYYIF